jgi:hypothetical protein
MEGEKKDPRSPFAGLWTSWHGARAPVSFERKVEAAIKVAAYIAEKCGGIVSARLAE